MDVYNTLLNMESYIKWNYWNTYTNKNKIILYYTKYINHLLFWARFSEKWTNI